MPDDGTCQRAGEETPPAAVPLTVAEARGRVGWLVAGDGGRLRYARFPAARRGGGGWVLFLPGYSEFIEKHLETIAELTACGHEVLALDWRGQGLSARALADRHKGHVESLDRHLNDLLQLAEETGFTAATGRPRLLIGHSMGAHLGLRLLAVRPDLIDRAVLLAPMLAIHTGPLPALLVAALLRLLLALGRGEAYAPGQGPRGEASRRFAGNPLTGDEVRFRRAWLLIDREPALAIGGPTVRWLWAAWQSMALLRRQAVAGAIATPLLIFGAGRDRVVRTGAIRRLARCLPTARYVELPEARHEILCERDAIRARFWHHAGQFLEAGGGRT